MIRVALAGASGKMGQELVRTLVGVEDIQLVAAVSRTGAGQDVGTLAGVEPTGVPLGQDLPRALEESKPDVLVDFTTPQQVAKHIYAAIEAGVHAVVGTTGLSGKDIAAIDAAAKAARVGVLIAPNFALGAILLIRFAREAARYFPDAEIIELHHDQKKDAPSGTSILTAEVINAARAGAPGSTPPTAGSADQNASASAGVGNATSDKLGPTSQTPMPHAPVVEAPGFSVPARGAKIGDVTVHSVRLPGLVAHQEVIFGGPGQSLTLRHDSFHRGSFMPGVLLGIRRISQVQGAVYGLEALLFPEESSRRV